MRIDSRSMRVLALSSVGLWAACTATTRAGDPAENKAMQSRDPSAQRAAADSTLEARASSETASPWVEPTRETPPGTKYELYQSEIVGGPASYLAYQPPQYDQAPERRFPVLYFLPGGQMDQRTGGAIVSFLDAAIRAEKIPPLIIIVPHGPPATMWTDSFDGKRPVESVIVKNLIPHVDTAYRTITAREGRWIEGFSVGGRGAAHLGFEHPDLFGAVSDLAGAMMEVDFFAQYAGGRLYKVCGEDREYFNLHDPYWLAEKNADAIRGKTVVRVMAGTADTMGNQVPGSLTAYQANVRFHEHLERLGVDHEFFAVPDVPHAYGPLLVQTGDAALEFYRKAFERLDKSEALTNK